MITYYNPRPGHSEWMRSLSSHPPEAYIEQCAPATCVPHEKLADIHAAIRKGCTLPNIAKELGVSYQTLRTQLKRAGYVYKSYEHGIAPPIDDVEPFVVWLESHGIACRKRSGSILYAVRIKDSTKHIKVVEGKIRLGTGLNFRYVEFCRERESGSVQG